MKQTNKIVVIIKKKKVRILIYNNKSFIYYSFLKAEDKVIFV